MSDQDNDQEKYKQLGLFSIIVAEMTLVPAGLTGVVYYFTRNSDPLGVSWKVWTGMAAAAGFAIAFYRIYLMTKALNRNGK